MDISPRKISPKKKSPKKKWIAKASQTSFNNLIALLESGILLSFLDISTQYSVAQTSKAMYQAWKLYLTKASSLIAIMSINRKFQSMTALKGIISKFSPKQLHKIVICDAKFFFFNSIEKNNIFSIFRLPHHLELINCTIYLAKPDDLRLAPDFPVEYLLMNNLFIRDYGTDSDLGMVGRFIDLFSQLKTLHLIGHQKTGFENFIVNVQNKRYCGHFNHGRATKHKIPHIIWKNISRSEIVDYHSADRVYPVPMLIEHLTSISDKMSIDCGFGIFDNMLSRLLMSGNQTPKILVVKNAILFPDRYRYVLDPLLEYIFVNCRIRVNFQLMDPSRILICEGKYSFEKN